MASGSDVPADLEAIRNRFAGEWKLMNSEGLDEYLKFIGLNFLFRKVAGNASCTVIISVEENKVRLITKGPKTQDHAFNLNTEVDDSDPVGNEMTAVVTFEDGKLVTNSKPRNKSNAKVTKVTREVIAGVKGKPDEMIMTVEAGTLVMKRFFVKQN
ncbi:fatty acid-binding protein, heart-like [Mizuhopecten yessoensis]|uniref:Fatty acid-binding protein-like 6 n=1 Tax=Mizuhopecten yessoensis TaxID=6573 RepID=A0A210QH39_MIZYE|nr:fatty acid-binding protein, heart-like [Mizuhopecten yessoensis]OWF48078.1 Fatty acid-binding protein-like 6 [Mizuhopecten yessoensis]